METLKYQAKTKARKEHRCDFCDQRISKGETYLKSTHKCDIVYDFKMHRYCVDIANKLKMYDYAEDGITQEIFMETVSSEFFNLMVAIFPENEKAKYTDVIQQLRNVRWIDKFSYVIRHYNKTEKQ